LTPIFYVVISPINDFTLVLYVFLCEVIYFMVIFNHMLIHFYSVHQSLSAICVVDFVLLCCLPFTCLSFLFLPADVN
jgi:hypothetical protein